VKRIVVSGAVLALAMAGTGLAHAQKPAESGFKVTGGGQIIMNAQGGGAGDTVGFNAHALSDETDEARGQFQYVPRDNDSANAQDEKFHGVVTCLLSGGEAQANEAAEEDDQEKEALLEGMARFGGHFRDDPSKFFTVDVSDDGQGNTGNDMILVRITDEPCADNPEDEEQSAEELLKLGRGNVKIHNNPDSAGGGSEEPESSSTAAKGKGRNG
jgi:hypothetical protein